MNRTRLVTLTVMSLGIATPLFSQDRGYSSYSYPAMGTNDATASFAGRLYDYRRLVIKKTRQDGGALTAVHKSMLDRRLRRMLAEQGFRIEPNSIASD